MSIRAHRLAALVLAGVLLGGGGGLVGGCERTMPTPGHQDEVIPPPPPPQDDPAEAPAPPAAAPDPGAPPADPGEEPERIELEEGLVIEELVVGEGDEAYPGATVIIHYRGTLTDGAEFETSRPGPPAEFPLDRLIRGWQIGIPGMKVGGTRRLHVPYQLGYGERGKPPTIPPRADLIFEVELLGVK